MAAGVRAAPYGCLFSTPPILPLDSPFGKVYYPAMQTKDRTLIFGGMARLPKEITEAEVFQVIAEVDEATAKVLKIEIDPGSMLILELLKQTLVGMSLKNDVYVLLQEIDQRLFHRAKKAVIVAVKDMAREYRESQAPKPPLIIADPFNK
jgi:hypothetical protein